MAIVEQAPVGTQALTPYVFFYGRCEEALVFYKGVFGGTYEIMRVCDSPVAAQMPPDFGDKVMHASFSAPGIAFFASDGREIKAVDPEAGNIALVLNAADAATGEQHPLEALFAHARQAETEDDGFLVEGDWDPSGTASDASADNMPADDARHSASGEAAVRWPEVFSGTSIDVPSSAPGHTASTVAGSSTIRVTSSSPGWPAHSKPSMEITSTPSRSRDDSQARLT